MNIREKLSTIQAEFKAKKSRKNSFGNYMFRSAEDILEALKPYNKEHGVYFTIRENLTQVTFQYYIVQQLLLTLKPAIK